MAFLSWLEQTAFAHYIQESSWGYPIVLSTHAVGMALLAGIVLMINFRMLGFARALPLRYLQRLMRFALFGFVLNLISGLALFAANATGHATNIAFIIKMVLLTFAGTLLVMSSRWTLSPNGVDVAGVESDGSRLVASVSIVAWLGVIVAGRLIAYAK